MLSEWNDAMNNRDYSLLEKLYDSTVKYYGKNYSREQCLEDKRKFFEKNPGFSQKVSGNTTIEWVDSTTYLVSFPKTVRFRGEEKDYPSYLKMRISNGNILICAESDVITDRIIEKNNSDKSINSQRLNYYYEPEISVLSGILRSQWFYGPPNYGETPKTDKKETCYILILDSPIDVLSGEKDEFNKTERSITDIQLVILDYAPFHPYLNQRIEVSGKLFHSETGHHHTKVLMEDVKILN